MPPCTLFTFDQQKTAKQKRGAWRSFSTPNTAGRHCPNFAPFDHAGTGVSSLQLVAPVLATCAQCNLGAAVPGPIGRLIIGGKIGVNICPTQERR